MIGKRNTEKLVKRMRETAKVKASQILIGCRADAVNGKLKGRVAINSRCVCIIMDRT
jgi:hypothetical protein